MRRKDREITSLEETVNIIDNTGNLHLGLNDGKYPYIVPLHYGYEFIDGKFVFYMHSAKEGHKINLIKNNVNASIEIENNGSIVSGGEVPCKYGSTFASVMAKGTIEIVTDLDDKIHGLRLLMRHQTGRDFIFDEDMVKYVEVLKFTACSYTAKRRNK